MLVTCPKTCKLGKSTTDASLDVTTNDAVCNDCGVVVEISSFAKISMKNIGDVIKDKKKAFIFDCKTCGQKAEAVKKSGKIVGKGCHQGNCMLNITKAMQVAIDHVKKDDQEEGE
jgi:hypothetical protein